MNPRFLAGAAFSLPEGNTNYIRISFNIRTLVICLICMLEAQGSHGLYNYYIVLLASYLYYLDEHNTSYI